MRARKEVNLNIAGSRSDPPWCSAMQRRWTKDDWSTTSFLPSRCSIVLGCVPDGCCRVIDQVGRSERYVHSRGHFVGRLTNDISSCSWPHPCQLLGLPCTRDHRCSCQSFMTSARPHSSVEVVDLRRHCSTLPVFLRHGHADNSTCQSRWSFGGHTSVGGAAVDC